MKIMSTCDMVALVRSETTICCVHWCPLTNVTATHHLVSCIQHVTPSHKPRMEQLTIFHSELKMYFNITAAALHCINCHSSIYRSDICIYSIFRLENNKSQNMQST